jgi:hypothetical protein
LARPRATRKRIAALLLIFPLAVASYRLVRLARADAFFRSDTLEGARRAVRLDAGNARYHAWLAEVEEHEGLDPQPELQLSTALNPRDSAVLIRLGLVAEQRGDAARAERDLLEAARIDRQYDPRATLANYYFRRGAQEPFWRWAREAFAVGYGDLRPLFQLCWRMTDNPAVVRAALPDDRAVLASYLGFLLQENGLDAAAPAARELAAQAEPADRDLLLAAVDRLIESPDSTAALAVWNPLCGRLLACAPLDPEGGVSLTNPAFRSEPLQRGFDWRVSHDPEITAARENSPPLLRISLSGRQPEFCELLAQVVPLAARRRYRLRVRYRSAGLAADTGIRWRIATAELPLRASDEWSTVELLFQTEAAVIVRLSMIYQRAPGSTRAEGSMIVGSVELRFQ